MQRVATQQIMPQVLLTQVRPFESPHELQTHAFPLPLSKIDCHTVLQRHVPILDARSSVTSTIILLVTYSQAIQPKSLQLQSQHSYAPAARSTHISRRFLFQTTSAGELAIRVFLRISESLLSPTLYTSQRVPLYRRRGISSHCHRLNPAPPSRLHTFYCQAQLPFFCPTCVVRIHNVMSRACMHAVLGGLLHSAGKP